jgi:hypothetical protein
MPLPDRDPTAGELRIMFENIMAALRDVKETMATKEFVNTKFDNYNERMVRLEEDVRVWISNATTANAEIKEDTHRRIDEVKADLVSETDELHKRIDEIVSEKTDSEKSKKARTVAITLAIVGAGLSLAVSIVSAIIINTLIP